MEPWGSLSHSQKSATSLYTKINPVDALPTEFLTSILILSSHLDLSPPSCLFLSGFQMKTLCAPHLSPTSATRPDLLVLLGLTTRVVRGTDHKAPSNAVFSTPLLLRPS
jgi:hypothetical protein